MMDKERSIILVEGLFSPKECLWFLHRGFDESVYRIYPGKIRRAFFIGGEKTLVDIHVSAEGFAVEWLVGERTAASAVYVQDFLTEWFDLERGLEPFYGLLSRHKKLAYMAERYAGLRFVGMPDLFEALSWGIIGQQINLSFAFTLKRRLIERYGSFVEYEGDPYWLFPSPKRLAEVDPLELRELQFSTRKAEYLIDTAKAFADQTLSKEKLRELPDFPSRQKYLTGMRGIGIWTANYALMKSLKEPSSIPHGDAGLLNALVKHKIMKDKQDLRALEKLFKGFRDWESYLVLYLWRSLAALEGEEQTGKR